MAKLAIQDVQRDSDVDKIRQVYKVFCQVKREMQGRVLRMG